MWREWIAGDSPAGGAMAPEPLAPQCDALPGCTLDHLFCGNPKSTLLVPGSGQRLVTSFACV